MAHAMPQVAGVKHKFIRVGDLNLHIALAGEGEPVLLVHGWPQHWYAWRLVIPRLAQRYRVIAMDIRGFGWSDIAWDGFETESMAEDIFGLIDALELDRVRYVGHGWGGWIGLAAALSRPDRIERLFALSVLPPWLRPTPGNLAALARLRRQAAVATPLVGPLLCRRKRFVTRTIRRAARNRANLDRQTLRIYARDLRASTRARAATLLHRTFLSRELLPVLGGRYRDRHLATPTLIACGQRDLLRPRILGSPAMPADDLRVETVPRAGHFLPEEAPEWVADRALAFFDETGRPAPDGGAAEPAAAGEPV
jgi:pimeloyl-ACP methyl ester carboxylesterase